MELWGFRARQARRFATVEEALEKSEEPTAPDTTLARRKGRVQASLAVFCAIGIVAGTRMAHTHSAATFGEETLAGTWELESVNGDRVGPNVDSVVVSQSVTFQNGKIHGETLLNKARLAPNTALPFPDESVTQVHDSTDGQEMRIVWEGSYTLDDHQQLALHVGNATYLDAASWNDKTRALQFSHDIILTYPGATRYHAAAPQEQSASSTPAL